MLKDLVVRTRSYRRFHEDQPVSMETLRELVDLARLAASARNGQPLRYVLCNDRATNAAIFATLAWAGYLTDWPGPAEGERPAAYIVTLSAEPKNPGVGVDEGLALQSILLGATERGLGGCILGSVKREEVRRILEIPKQYEILHVLALGVPGETVVIETVGVDGDTKYWRDASSVHHVPKRRLEDIIIAAHG